MWQATQDKIESRLGRRVRQMQPLAGGMVSQTLRVDLADGASLVAKIGDSHDLSIEAYMLRYLRAQSELPVPAVLYAAPDLLIMEYVAGQSALHEDSLLHLGELLAACHQITGPAYGHERDTLIGPLPQPNPYCDSWITFFREHRLLYMLELARQSGKLPPALERSLQDLAGQLERYLIEPDGPVLIHGDMWRANVLTRAGRVVAIIDPALYYAHNEMELAYMTLFDGIGPQFFAAYQTHIAIDRDFFAIRRHIYNLYPLLIHLVYFGEKYIPHLKETVNKIKV